MNLEKDVAPTGLYNYLPKSQRRTAWQKKTGRRGIGTLKEGLLKKVGYSASASVTRRHAAVKRAVKKYGRTSTIRKLNAVAVYTRKRAPKTSRKFKADMKFAQKLKGGVFGKPEKIETAIAQVDRGILANQKDLSEAPASQKMINRARGLGAEVPKGANLGEVRYALEEAQDTSMGAENLMGLKNKQW